MNSDANGAPVRREDEPGDSLVSGKPEQKAPHLAAFCGATETQVGVEGIRNIVRAAVERRSR